MDDPTPTTDPMNTPERGTITTKTPDYRHPEINAMAIIAAGLDSIDEEAHARVLRWVLAKYEIEV